METEIEHYLKEIAEDPWLSQIRYYVPSAWIGHAPFLKFLIRELKPKIFVELGTHNGFSYFVGCQAIQEINLPTKAFAVDHWLGDSHAGKFDDSVYSSVVNLNDEFANFSTLLKMTFFEARTHFENESVDLLHIDGFHTYEAVKDDFETWIPKMSKSGVVLLHDIHVRHADFGVYKFWEELKRKYESIEFVGSYGLGVIFLGSLSNPALSKIREYSKKDLLPQIQGVFGCLSDGVVQKYRQIENESLRSSTNSLKSAVVQLQSQVHTINEEMASLLNSKSWKLTKTLRFLARLFRRVY